MKEWKVEYIVLGVIHTLYVTAENKQVAWMLAQQRLENEPMPFYIREIALLDM